MYYSVHYSRAAAAILVLLFHLSANLAKPKYFGTEATTLQNTFAFGGVAGVSFFFVLSGFIITLLHRKDIGKRAMAVPFVIKRVKRVYPTYIVLFGAVFAATYAIPSLRGTLPNDWVSILRALSLVPQDPSVVGGTGAPVLVVAWSLQYEIMFYFAFACAIYSRYFMYLWASITLCALIAVASHPMLSFPASFIGNQLVLLFVAGAIVGKIVGDGTALHKNAAIVVLLCSLAAFAGVCVLHVRTGEIFAGFNIALLYGIASSALIYGLVNWERTRAEPKKTPLLHLLGDSSYALYLIHFPLVAFLCKVARRLQDHLHLPLIAWFSAITVTCVSVAACFHIWVERPITKPF